jgi:hypothetical protein
LRPIRLPQRPLRSIRASTTIPAPRRLPRGAASTTATAFDYRIRYYFETLPDRPLAAHLRATLLAGECFARTKGGLQRLKRRLSMFVPPWYSDVVALFFEELDCVLVELKPVNRRLHPEEEETLA